LLKHKNKINMKKGNPGPREKNPCSALGRGIRLTLVPRGWVAFFLLREKKGNPPPRDQSSLIPRPRGEKGYFNLKLRNIYAFYFGDDDDDDNHSIFTAQQITKAILGNQKSKRSRYSSFLNSISIIYCTIVLYRF